MENPIYKNPNEPIESRIKDLLSRMTVKEKLGQMTQIERSVATPSVIKDLCIGSILSCGGSGPFEKATSSDWAEMVDSFQKSALESRLGIPILYGIDAVHGNNNVYGATIFPHNVALGATRDVDLVRSIGEATAIEVRASGIHYDFAPCVALHRDIAREAVRKSLVLLRNGKDLNKPFLPLDKNAKKILVAGVHADDLGYQCGGWTATWEGKSGKITQGTTILEAIKQTVGDKTEVIYEQNPSTQTLANQDFAFAIVVVGETPFVETMGDNSELIIPLNGNELIKSVANKVPTLVILISGRPLVLEPEILEKTDAFVAAWLPGSEGGGVADVIFGDYEFEGRLPVTWFKKVEQLPMISGENDYDPLFPIGFGLKIKEVSM